MCGGFHEYCRTARSAARIHEKPVGTVGHGYVARMPGNFCEFNAIYGYDRASGPAPLYNETLHEVLPKLEEFVSAEELADLYIGYAINATWDADNINFMQYAYRRVVASVPLLFVQAIEARPKEHRLNAMRFLFDGPHPENDRQLYENVASKICAIDESTCAELKTAWHQVLDSWAH